MPPAYADEFARRIPGARVETWIGAGHAPHLEQPETVGRLVRDFLGLVASLGRVVRSGGPRSPERGTRRLFPAGGCEPGSAPSGSVVRPGRPR